MKTSVKGFMFYVAFVASLGGLLFGFDTAVISGAEKAIQGIYALSDFAHGFTIATALIGTIVGALVCGGPAERYGRLRSLKVIAWLYLISAVGSAVIVNWYSFMFFRFLGGLAVGASSVVGPMYIAEISPSHWRGRFVAFFQFNIVHRLPDQLLDRGDSPRLAVDAGHRGRPGTGLRPVADDRARKPPLAAYPQP